MLLIRRIRKLGRMKKEIEAYHENPILQTYMLFIQTAREVIKYSDSRFFWDSNLSTVKYITLKALVLSGGTLTNSELTKWTGTTRHNITTLVKRMKAEGLVNTERNTEDKRFVHVILTDNGRDVFQKAGVVAHDLIKRVMSGISKREAAQLDRLLKIMKDNTTAN
jgi:DNA-binding MarR family transcriptional regulator